VEKQAAFFILTTDHHARPATGGVKGEAKL